MARVLHLLDEQADESAALALRLSADAARIDPQPHDRHAWLLLGGESMRHAASAAGIDPACVRQMPRPSGLRKILPGANRALKALINQADRVECWTIGAATLAAQLGCPHARPRLGQATLCGFARGMIQEAVLNPPPLREGPGEGAELQSGCMQRRAELRKRWGVEPDTIVVALLADHPARVDAREAMMAVALTFETLAAAKVEQGDVRLLCHPLCKRRSQGNDLADQLSQPQLVLQDAGLLSPWRTLAGCDLAIAPQPRHAGLSILWASALGLPVIAGPEPCLPMLDQMSQVSLVPGSDAKHMAHRLTTWVFAQQPQPTPC